MTVRMLSINCGDPSLQEVIGLVRSNVDKMGNDLEKVVAVGKDKNGLLHENINRPNDGPSVTTTVKNVTWADVVKGK